MDARFVKDKLEQMLGTKVFLDSDNLQDLRLLLDHVRQSDVLVLFQTAEVLQRPYCILEINAAVKAQVPIVALNLRGKGYDFMKSMQFMRHLDTELEKVNPGAPALLRANGLEPVEAAYVLSSVVPNIISV